MRMLIFIQHPISENKHASHDLAGAVGCFY